MSFFTDSMIVMGWIHSESRNFKPFVSARIGEIQSNSHPSQWRHIPSADNAADDLSRGLHVDELNGRWIKGPEFLQFPVKQWPNAETVVPKDEDLERRHVQLVASTSAKPEAAYDVSRFSSWRKLIRVTARIKDWQKKYD